MGCGFVYLVPGSCEAHSSEVFSHRSPVWNIPVRVDEPDLREPEPLLGGVQKWLLKEILSHYVS